MVVGGYPVAESKAHHHKYPIKAPQFVQKIATNARRPQLSRAWRLGGRSIVLSFYFATFTSGEQVLNPDHFPSELHDADTCPSRMSSRSEIEVCLLLQRLAWD